MKWFRMYVEIIDDPKMKTISDRSFRIFNYLLCLAAEAEQDGLIPLSKSDIVWRLRITEKDLTTCIKELSQANIINQSYPLQFTNWNKRQYKSDDVTERTKRFKEKKRNVSGNVPRNDEGTFTGTAPDTDTDTDIKATTVVNDLKGPGNGNAKDAFLKKIQSVVSKIRVKFPDPYFNQDVLLFIQSNTRRNPDALVHCLESLLKAQGPIVKPKAYLDAAMKIEDGKFNAAESERISNEHKTAPINLGALIQGIGKPI